MSDEQEKESLQSAETPKQEKTEDKSSSRKRRIGLLLAFLLLLIFVSLIGGGGYYFLQVLPSSTEHPAMLRTISGNTTILQSESETWAAASDETYLEPNARIRVSEDGLAALQYYGGGITLLTGPTEIQFTRFEEESKGLLSSPANYIDITVLYGKVI